MTSSIIAVLPILTTNTVVNIDHVSGSIPQGITLRPNHIVYHDVRGGKYWCSGLCGSIGELLD